jgi:hypothetical protein
MAESGTGVESGAESRVEEEGQGVGVRTERTQSSWDTWASISFVTGEDVLRFT